MAHTPSKASGVSEPFNVDTRRLGGFQNGVYVGESDDPPVGTLAELLAQVSSSGLGRVAVGSCTFACRAWHIPRVWETGGFGALPSRGA